MKKTKHCLRLLLLLSLCITLTACGFVDYILYDDADTHVEFEDALDEYLAKIKEIAYPEEFREEERRELTAALLDAENQLRECQTVEELEEVYNKHYDIIMAIPTELSFVLDGMLDELYGHVSLDDYRQAEQKIIKELIAKYESALKSTRLLADAEKLFREFEAEIFELKTDAVYLAEELVVMKKEYGSYYGKNVNYALYRQEQRDTIDSLTESFKSDLEAAENTKTATALYTAYVSAIEALPTDSSLFNAEKSALISNWTEKLNSFALKYSLSADTQIAAALQAMSGFTDIESINRKGASLIISLCEGLGETALEDMRDAAKIYVDNAVERALYRPTEYYELYKAKDDLNTELDAAQTTTDILNILELVNSSFADIPTDRQLTQQEQLSLLEDLENNYDGKILVLPDMTKASSYDELAKIIDIYAFYQTSSNSFLRNTFRVELNFPFRAAQWEINEVYWYCELIRSGAGITGYIEDNSNCFVITLIPYDIASVSNTDTPIQVSRYNSLVEYGGRKTFLAKRLPTFNDFPYLTKYSGKEVAGVWNTQQLWYALEHEYIPLTKPNSPAERALVRAKEILREIICEGMSDEEKIFAIFSWFGENMSYDHAYNKYLYPADREHFPDELAATLNSFHAEGALFDNLSVCCAFAKSYLILLRLEGIEAYRVFIHSYTENAIDNLGKEGYGSHAILAIRMSDGKFYYSDPEQAYLHTDERFVKYHQLAVSPDLHWPYDDGWTNMYKDFVFGTDVNSLMSEKLTYNGKSIFVDTEEELNAILDDFAAESGKNIQVSVFCYSGTDFSPLGIISNDGRFDYITFSFGGLTEYIIFK